MKLLALRHMESDHIGCLPNMMRARGLSITVVDAHTGVSLPGADEYDMLLVMGGPQQVWEVDKHEWLSAEIDFIRHWVSDLQKPYFGVCLGHQLLAVAPGGEVGPGRQYEVGFPAVELLPTASENPLFSCLPERSHWLQWHEAEVTRAPSELTVLASSESCLIQAMALGTRCVSVQFHLEGNKELVDQWTSDHETASAMQAMDGESSPARMLAEANQHLDDAMYHSELLFGGWLALNTKA